MADKGLKYDESPYLKPDLSLIPWHILMHKHMNKPTKNNVRQVFYEIHKHLNSGKKTTVDFVQELFILASEEIPIERMAVSLGYGAVKYERNNWMKGFGGDPNRFLRACMRHCYALYNGELYDGAILPSYDKGNPYDGAILFSLMVAMYECRQ